MAGVLAMRENGRTHELTKTTFHFGENSDDVDCRWLYKGESFTDVNFWLGRNEHSKNATEKSARDKLIYVNYYTFTAGINGAQRSAIYCEIFCFNMLADFNTSDSLSGFTFWLGADAEGLDNE